MEKPRIVCCLPGEGFPMPWVANWTGLAIHLFSRYQFAAVFKQESNVYLVRQDLLDQALQAKPDFILWMDDDNLLTAEQFETLMRNMQRNPDAILVGAWCWVMSDLGQKAVVSCGYYDRKGKPQPMEYRDLMAAPDLYDAGWTGFPAVLMRVSLLDRLPHVPFAPVIGPEFRKGFSSEDTGFCVRAKNAGLRILIDPRVKVPHLKRFPAEPKEVAVDTGDKPCQDSNSGV